MANFNHTVHLQSIGRIGKVIIEKMSQIMISSFCKKMSQILIKE